MTAIKPVSLAVPKVFWSVPDWIGDKHPSGASQKLLNLLDRKGLEVLN